MSERTESRTAAPIDRLDQILRLGRGPAEGPRERFVMCPPKYLSTRIPNNVWMESQPINVPRAMAQYERIKNTIIAYGTDVLEIPPVKGCQDQTYVANVAIAIDPYIILSRYKAPGRDCEVPAAAKFFHKLGYQKIVQSPHSFEGEADLKKFHDDVYLGGWGQFTDPKALDWIEEETGITIVRLHETNPKLYHLDCSVFVIDDQNILVTSPGLDRKSISALNRIANVIITPSNIATTGITNGVKIPHKRIFLSGTLNTEDKEYRDAMEWLNTTFDRFGYTVVLLDVDEFDKSGADLSCAIMHLNF